jgi:hypothetical protein
MFVIENDDLIKAKTHKYIKRTGTPGNYKYWYKDASGRLVSHEDDDHSNVKVEHLKRVIAGRMRGVHSMTDAEIAAHVGLDRNKVGQHVRNMRRPTNTSAASYDENELHEAKHGDVTSEEYTAKIGRIKEEIERRGASGEASSRSRTRRSPSQRGERSRTSTETTQEAPRGSRQAEGRTQAQTESSAQAEDARTTQPQETAEQRKEREKKEKIKQKREQLRAMFGIALDEEGSTSNPSSDQDPDDPRNDPRAGLDQDEEQEFDRRQAEAAAPQYEQHSSLTRNGKEAAVFKFQNEEGETRYAVSKEGGEPQGSYTSLETAKRMMENHVGPAALSRAQKQALSQETQRQMRGLQIPVTEMNALSEEVENNFRINEMDTTQSVRQAIESFKQRGIIQDPNARSATQAQGAAQEAVSRARETMESETTQELHSASPELASSDAAINEMIAQQAEGKNPYVQRAKKFYDRIKNDMTPVRRDTLKHLFAAFERVGEQTGENAIKSAYAQIQREAGTGETAWSKVKGHISPGLFHDPEELFNNEPVNVDMERMKRGFGKMQFERMKPFLGNAFKSAHPDAPPPYPTYDDLKTWEEHGSRPEWATAGPGRAKTKRAVPKEFHDSMPKGSDGKVLNPPGWMPLHLTPVWNYLAKRAGSAAYAEQGPNSNEISQQRLNFPSQGQLAGHMKNSLRNFVQMRGENNFADIPKAKAEAYGIDLADLYKSDSEAGLHRVLTTKVIPMNEFVEFMNTQPMVKKSFSLVIDEDLKPLRFKKSFTIEEDMKKSELIKKIRNLKGIRFKE